MNEIRFIIENRLSLLNRCADRFYQIQEFFRTRAAIPYHELGKVLERNNTPDSTLLDLDPRQEKHIACQFSVLFCARIK
jgi:hypothetical protein